MECKLGFFRGEQPTQNADFNTARGTWKSPGQVIQVTGKLFVNILCQRMPPVFRGNDAGDSITHLPGSNGKRR
jgi:hypothetical protein